MARTEDETPFGEAVLEGLREGAAWKLGEIALAVRNAPSLAVEPVKAMRKSAAKTSRGFPPLRHPRPHPGRLGAGPRLPDPRPRRGWKA
jgi:hypothetical protein